MRALAALVLLLATARTVTGAECRQQDFDGALFSWCRIDMTTEPLRLWLNDASGAPFGTFRRLDEALAASGRQLGIAMNGGMYHQDRRPVGLYVEGGVEYAPIVTSEGPGNFGLLPNGVLCIGEHRARVIESRSFAARRPPCRHATQSGPMLVIDGALHPDLLPGSDSLFIRNGVGTSADGRTAVLAISDQPVSFHHFARFFRDRAGTPDALYLDGNVSRLYAPSLGRSDPGAPMGPILGTDLPAG